ncbi:MAG: alpha/beta hydrolase [Bacteroidota bacterium]
MLKYFTYTLVGLLLLESQSLIGQTRYLDSLFTSVEKITQEYAVKDGESLQLDIYSPKGDTLNNRPAMIWMHGGGFQGGTRDGDGEVEFMNLLAKRGYVAVSISYRLTAKGKGFSCDASRAEKMETFRKASWDLWDAIAYIHKNAEALGIDNRKLIIGGSSAGAEGALNAVYMRDWLYEGEHPYDIIQPMTVFSLAGAIIDARYINEKNAVPAVFFHGTADDLVPYATAAHHYCDAKDTGYIWLDGSRTIANRLNALKTPYVLYTYEEAAHEIAGIPFGRMQEVLTYFYILMNDPKEMKVEITIPKP